MAININNATCAQFFYIKVDATINMLLKRLIIIL